MAKKTKKDAKRDLPEGHEEFMSFVRSLSPEQKERGLAALVARLAELEAKNQGES